MFEIVFIIAGILASAVYIGYLAYTIGAVPLWVIVIATYVLAICEFVIEYRERTNHAAPNGHDR